jgi:hypothetical protein
MPIEYSTNTNTYNSGNISIGDPAPYFSTTVPYNINTEFVTPSQISEIRNINIEIVKAIVSLAGLDSKNDGVRIPVQYSFIPHSHILILESSAPTPCGLSALEDLSIILELNDGYETVVQHRKRKRLIVSGSSVLHIKYATVTSQSNSANTWTGNSWTASTSLGSYPDLNMKFSLPRVFKGNAFSDTIIRIDGNLVENVI